MSEELKKCPFCNSEAIQLRDAVAWFSRCSKFNCPGSLSSQWMRLDAWNTRPLEDALQQRIGELEAQLKNIVDACNAGDFDKVYDEYKHAETLLKK